MLPLVVAKRTIDPLSSSLSTVPARSTVDVAVPGLTLTSSTSLATKKWNRMRDSSPSTTRAAARRIGAAGTREADFGERDENVIECSITVGSRLKQGRGLFGSGTK